MDQSVNLDSTAERILHRRQTQKGITQNRLNLFKQKDTKCIQQLKKLSSKRKIELERSISISPSKYIMDRNILVNDLLAKQRKKHKLNVKQPDDTFESKMKIFEGIKSFIKSDHIIKNLNILNNQDSNKNTKDQAYTPDEILEL